MLSERREIFMALLGEGVDVCRPVMAERIDSDTWRVLGPVPAYELWEFKPGETVRLETRTFSNGKVLPVPVGSSKTDGHP